MDAFAWMKPAAPAERAATPVAVADPTQRLATGPTFVYNPWKLKELRRLYINLQDGSKVGYLDLATMAAVPESVETADMLRCAIDGLAPGASMAAPSLEPQPEPVQATEPQTIVMPWRDLARNRPGMLIENLDDASYRAGVAGEQRTAGVLAGLACDGYKVLHSVPLSPRKDIDHLVIGPTGIHAINTKTSTYAVTVKDGAAYADGYKQTWLDSLSRDAVLAADYLSRAARMDLRVQPLVAVWSTVSVLSSLPTLLVSGEGLWAAITRGEEVFRPAWVDVVYNVARRSDTWTANH